MSKHGYGTHAIPITTSIEESIGLDHYSPTESNFRDGLQWKAASNETARGIVYDWSRKNMELKNELKNIQDELKNEVSFAISDEVPYSGKFPTRAVAINSPKQAAETEHQALVDIISRVKSDLVLAASMSPKSELAD